MSFALDSAAAAWITVPRVTPSAITDARLQLHHAAQIANAPAMSYLPPASDDSHTNFGWNAALGAFVSRLVALPEPLSIAWRVRDLTLLALDVGGCAVATFPLVEKTFAEGHAWARAQCEAAGGDGARYRTTKHYEIPSHVVDAGAEFGADVSALTSLSTHWANAVRMLDAVAGEEPGASDVRLWPHHFDVGLLLTIDAKHSIGVGFTPGDDWYDEPYWYVSPYPAPVGDAPRPPLAGGAHWHEKGWFSAVLTWSAYANAGSQGHAAAAYLRSALAADRALLAG
ncbi:MAG TPA: hypothetical protein VIJ16_06445 [Gemmatimonadaceae bacterium]